MSKLNRYGFTYAPSSLSTELLSGWLNAWSYNFRNSNNMLRDEILRLRNVCDEYLTQYYKDLGERLQALRKLIPEPTRETIYDSLDGLELVKEVETVMRNVDALRIRVRQLGVPTDFNTYGSDRLHVILQGCELLDREILELLRNPSENLDAVSDKLDQRNAVIHQYE